MKQMFVPLVVVYFLLSASLSTPTLNSEPNQDVEQSAGGKKPLLGDKPPLENSKHRRAGSHCSIEMQQSCLKYCGCEMCEACNSEYPGQKFKPSFGSQQKSYPEHLHPGSHCSEEMQEDCLKYCGCDMCKACLPKHAGTHSGTHEKGNKFLIAFYYEITVL